MHISRCVCETTPLKAPLNSGNFNFSVGKPKRGEARLKFSEALIMNNTGEKLHVPSLPVMSHMGGRKAFNLSSYAFIHKFFTLR